jgi:hypothetical protein
MVGKTPVFNCTFFSRMETKMGMLKTEKNGTYLVSRKRTNPEHMTVMVGNR